MGHITVEYVTHSGDDLLVVNAARVSMDRRHDVLTEADVRLLKYLASHKHWSPFAHPQLTVCVDAPIFVARQLFRHQVGLAVNEVSRRYVSSEPELFTPDGFRQAPAENIKQGSGGPLPAVNQEAAWQIYDLLIHHALEAYDAMLDHGVAPEQARMVLPQAMMTKWYWTGSLFAFYRVVKDRMDAAAQTETREVAIGLDRCLKKLFPHSYSALCEAKT